MGSASWTLCRNIFKKRTAIVSRFFFVSIMPDLVQHLFEVSFAHFARDARRLGHENKQVYFRDSRLLTFACFTRDVLHIGYTSEQAPSCTICLPTFACFARDARRLGNACASARTSLASLHLPNREEAQEVKHVF